MAYRDFILRKITDPNFDHCATGPFFLACLEVIRTLKPGQKLDHNTINAICIPAEVALALSTERYGKPRIRIGTRLRDEGVEVK